MADSVCRDLILYRRPGMFTELDQLVMDWAAGNDVANGYVVFQVAVLRGMQRMLGLPASVFSCGQLGSVRLNADAVRQMQSSANFGLYCPVSESE